MSIKISQEESHFLGLARIAMIVALTYHHLFTIPNTNFFPRDSLSLDDFAFVEFLNAFVHWGTMAAVPLLSIISGYLFAKDGASIILKLRKRVDSILIPYLMWTILWFLFAFVLYFIGRDRGMFEWANYGFENLSPMLFLNGVVGITKSPFAFQFWFVHDLVLTLLLSPILFYIARHFALVGVGAFAFGWIIWPEPFPFFSGNVVVFFFVGLILARSSNGLLGQLEKLAPYQWWLVAVFIVMILCRAFHDALPSFFSAHAYLCVLRLVGVLAAGVFLRFMLLSWPKVSRRLVGFSSYSFMIFAIHYPVIEFVKVIVQRLPLQDTPVGLLLSFIMIPGVTIVICLMVAAILKNMMPKLYAVFNGGRK